MTEVTDVTATRSALGRVRGLARANATVVLRNRLSLSYALVLPLLPLGLLGLGERGDVVVGISNVSSVLMMALMFPLYYNLLSAVVSRRDELVLKRLRTGEAKDGEILVALALPGAVVTVTVAVVTVPIAMAAGLPAPVNPLLGIAGLLLACACFAALAVWTAAWTPNSETAQITSLPVLAVAALGLLRPVFPESWHPWVSASPGAAVNDLVRVAWFGRAAELGSTRSVGFSATWAELAPSMAVLVGWALIAPLLARRAMRWDPRT